MLTILSPMTICGILPKNIRHTINHLLSFFSLICSKAMNLLKLDENEDEIFIILYQLKMFPLVLF